MDERQRIIENTLVPHTAFNEALVRMTQCFKYANGSTEPICTAIVGEARTGKTRVMEEFRLIHPIVRHNEGLYVPILYVKTPSKPTVKSLVELLLQALKDPKFHIGTENNKTMRLFMLMQRTGTRMIMIDEFQHFYDKGLRAVMHHVADWLKIFVDDSKISLVVGGLPSCQAVLDQNEQLAGRFLSRVEMPRFDWNNLEHRAEFMDILEAFQESIGKYFDLPNLDSDEMAFRCYCATGGLMGYLTKFLRQLVWDAIDEDRKIISLDNFEAAHCASVWDTNKISGVANPFSKFFKLSPSPETLEKISLIGKAVVESSAPRWRGGRQPKPKSATAKIF